MQMIMSMINCACNVIRAAYPIFKDIWLARQKKAGKSCNSSQPSEQG